jgi:hypothetical protein
MTQAATAAAAAVAGSGDSFSGASAAAQAGHRDDVSGEFCLPTLQRLLQQLEGRELDCYAFARDTVEGELISSSPLLELDHALLQML